MQQFCDFMHHFGLLKYADKPQPGAGVQGTNLAIFSLSLGRFNQWLNVPSRVYSSADGDSFVQTLDLPRTRHQNAERFCFRKIMFAEKGLWLPQPVEARPCYPRFTGKSAKVRFCSAVDNAPNCRLTAHPWK